MGSGLVGPVGVSVLPPVSHKANLPSGLATVPVQTQHQAHLAKVARVTTGKQTIATICLTAQVNLSVVSVYLSD